jgi:hypothetical protein
MTAVQSGDAIACVPDLIAMARDVGMMHYRAWVHRLGDCGRFPLIWGWIPQVWAD